MYENCLSLEDVVKELVELKVAGVLMKRLEARYTMLPSRMSQCLLELNCVS